MEQTHFSTTGGPEKRILPARGERDGFSANGEPDGYDCLAIPSRGSLHTFSSVRGAACTSPIRTLCFLLWETMPAPGRCDCRRLSGGFFYFLFFFFFFFLLAPVQKPVAPEEPLHKRSSARPRVFWPGRIRREDDEKGPTSRLD